MPSYLITEEPWIPVKTLKGSHEDVGLIEFYRRAHEFRCIEGLRPMLELGLLKFLIAFSCCSIEPSGKESIHEILQAGRFPMDKIDAYLRLLSSEGVSFDIYDETHPFAQAWDEENHTKAMVPVIKMDRSIPSGDNVLYRAAKTEDEYVWEPRQVAVGIFAFQVQAVSQKGTGGHQMYGGPSAGQIPIQYYPTGKNLFETIVFSFPHVLPKGDEEYWRSRTRLSVVLYKAPKGEVPDLSGTEAKKDVLPPRLALFFPTRYIRAIPEKNGYCRNIYIGLSHAMPQEFLAPDFHKMLNVAYSEAKAGKNRYVTFRSNQHIPEFHLVSKIFEEQPSLYCSHGSKAVFKGASSKSGTEKNPVTFSSMPAVFQNGLSAGFFGKKPYHVLVFQCWHDKSNYLQSSKKTILFPGTEIAASSNLRQEAWNLAQEFDYARRMLRWSIVNSLGENANKKAHLALLAEKTIFRFAKDLDALYYDYLDRIGENMGVTEDVGCRQHLDVLVELRKMALHVYSDAIRPFRKASDIRYTERMYQILYYSLMKGENAYRVGEKSEDVAENAMGNEI